MRNSKTKIYCALLIAMFSTPAFAASDLLTQDSSKHYPMKPIQHHDLTTTSTRDIDGIDIIGQVEETIYLTCSSGYSGIKYQETKDYGRTWQIVNTCQRIEYEVRGRECPAPKTGSITQKRTRTDYEDGRPSTYSNWETYEDTCVEPPVPITERSATVMACPAGMTPAENQANSVGAYKQLTSGGGSKTVSYNYYDKVLALAEGPSEIIMVRQGNRYPDGTVRDYTNWTVEANNCYRASLQNENEDCHSGGPGLTETPPNAVQISIANMSKWDRSGLVGRVDPVWVKIPGSVSTQPSYMLGIWDTRNGYGKKNRFERAVSEMAACSGG